MSFSIISNENVFSKSQGTNRTQQSSRIGPSWVIFPKLYSVYWGYYTKAISDLFQSEENQRFAKRKREDLISTKLVEQTSTSTLIGEKKTIETLFEKRTRKLFFLAQKKTKTKQNKSKNKKQQQQQNKKNKKTF